MNSARRVAAIPAHDLPSDKPYGFEIVRGSGQVDSLAIVDGKRIANAGACLRVVRKEVSMTHSCS